jgi:ABC-type bacteriocin/lantibiotic exporter with double-glycine peptidase domain
LPKWITGLYLPDEGQVSWDGIDIAKVDQHELQFAVVLQNPASGR